MDPTCPRKLPWRLRTATSTFRVALDATKNEIKTSVEQLFKVRVDDVRTLRVKGKSKRNRFGVHTSSTWKKAYVRLEQGQEIDLAAIS